MLTENDVVDAVCDYLEAKAYRPTRMYAHQHGIDIVAERGTTKVLIEAKGETPVGGDGILFTRNQFRTHVAVAFYSAAKLLREPPPIRRERRRVAIALPDNQHHAEFVGAIATSLRDLGIGVFWVSEARVVRLSGPWRA